MIGRVLAPCSASPQRIAPPYSVWPVGSTAALVEACMRVPSALG